jgi:type IV pilus assembly protein PilM
MRVPLLYSDEPVFGFDLGSRMAKMIQLKPTKKGLKVVGYGSASFPGEAIVEGIIVDPEEIATAIKPALKRLGAGQITAKRVAASLPVSKVFTRVLDLPPMNQADLTQAVSLEAEQYIPVPTADLYIDYEIIEKDSNRSQVLMVAAPRAIVDSYMQLFDLCGLEAALLESSLSATTRAVVSAMPLNKPTLVADIGSSSIDLTVYDKIIRLTNTIPLGGDTLTQQLAKDLKIKSVEANEIKFKFGVGPSGLQPKVMASLGAPLKRMCDEMRKVIKYYQERSDNQRKIELIIVGGGSASMPGFLEYMAAEISVPVIVASPWDGLIMHDVEKPKAQSAPMYTTAIGLARLEGQL